MYKLLIVDDETKIRAGLKVIVEKGRMGIGEIYEAEDGKQGMDVILAHFPDIVITDIRMPNMDGLAMMEKVNERSGKKPAFIILSGYDDFTYAKKAIKYGVVEYLLKPVKREELLELLSQIIDQLESSKTKHEEELRRNIQNKESNRILREKQLGLLLESDDLEEYGFNRQLEGLGIQFRGDIFCVIVVDYKHHSMDSRSNFGELDKFALKNVADEAISEITGEFCSLYDSAGRLVIILNGSKETIRDELIRTIYLRMNTCLQKYLKIDTFAGVGECVTELKKVKESYYEACSCVKKKLFSSPGNILFRKDSAENREKFRVYSPEILAFKKIAGEIELCNRSQLINLIDEYFRELDSYKGDGSRYEVFYSRLFSYITNYFTHKGTAFFLYFENSENRIQDFEEFWNVSCLNTYIKRYLLRLCDFISIQRNGSPDKKIVEQVIEYVNDHYDKDINLNIISEHMGKNNSYLSSLFKKEMGRNFIDYLIDVRIHKAKDLLEQTDMKIYDIAKKVGYTNDKYFFMAFKKVVGVSPQQYRDTVL